MHELRRLRIERLESRALLVVGSSAIPPPVERGAGFDGVVGVDLDLNSTNTSLFSECSGSLLSTRRHILTAAHCVDENGDAQADGPVRVVFDAATFPDGQFLYQDVPASAITVHPDWFDVGLGADVAVLTLPAVAPRGAVGYDIYRGSSETGSEYTVVGYGRTGDGSVGQNNSNNGPHGDVRRAGSNQWDADASILVDAPLFDFPAPPAGTALASDFDNGFASRDAFGRLYGIVDEGLGAAESLAAQGDSGGPVFIDEQGVWQIAGIVSYGVDRQTNSGLTTDVSNTFITFGEINVDTRVSAYATFIDAAVASDRDIVLDMRLQPDGFFDHGADELTLDVVEGALVITLAGEVVYLDDSPLTIASLTFLGSGDAESLTIGDLPARLLDRLTIDPGGGASTILWSGAAGLALTNPANRFDVNSDGYVTPTDVINVVNAINAGQGGELAEKETPGGPFVDVSGDGLLTPVDVIQVLNYLADAEALTQGVAALSVRGDAPALEDETVPSSDRAKTPLATSDAQQAHIVALGAAVDKAFHVVEDEATGLGGRAATATKHFDDSLDRVHVSLPVHRLADAVGVRHHQVAALELGLKDFVFHVRDDSERYASDRFPEFDDLAVGLAEQRRHVPGVDDGEPA